MSHYAIVSKEHTNRYYQIFKTFFIKKTDIIRISYTLTQEQRQNLLENKNILISVIDTMVKIKPGT